jgi:7,8-dihydro-6-hydroxymethylpterin-pyrophosphokinase
LLPLNEIAAGLVHPVLHKTIAQLLEECTDELDVQKKSRRLAMAVNFDHHRGTIHETPFYYG